MNKPRHLIAVDLDGTLFNDDKQVMTETAEALERASENGHEIVIATGRPLMGIPENVREIEAIRYAITCNGGGIYNIRTGECISQSPMSCEKALEVLSGLSPFNISIDAFIDGKPYKEEKQKAGISDLVLSEFMKSYIRDTRIYVDDLYAFIKQEQLPVQKFTLNFKLIDNVLIDREKTYEYLGTLDGICVVSGGMSNLEITLDGVNKGRALLETADKLGIDRNNTIAFGDSENDLTMIVSAGVGVAMGNATDEIKNSADMTTASNNENGIGKALEKLL